MTERSRRAVARNATEFVVGPSALSWEDDTLVITIHETSVPIPSSLKGTVRIRPKVLPKIVYPLEEAERHWWQPIAPQCDIDVSFTAPRLRWKGQAYLDSNYGSAPLEEDFVGWTWSRTHEQGGAGVLYEAQLRDGSETALSVFVDSSGKVEDQHFLPVHHLPKTLWRIDRQTRADEGTPVNILQTLEDTPFYSRTLIEAQLFGRPTQAFHESLSLDRFAAPWVRLMLPFRMPRFF